MGVTIAIAVSVGLLFGITGFVLGLIVGRRLAFTDAQKGRCLSCGILVRPGGIFCHYCGARVDGT